MKCPVCNYDDTNWFKENKDKIKPIDYDNRIGKVYLCPDCENIFRNNKIKE